MKGLCLIVVIEKSPTAVTITALATHWHSTTLFAIGFYDLDVYRHHKRSTRICFYAFMHHSQQINLAVLLCNSSYCLNRAYYFLYRVYDFQGYSNRCLLKLAYSMHMGHIYTKGKIQNSSSNIFTWEINYTGNG